VNIPFIAGIAFALFGIYMLIHAMTGYRKALASSSWPSVNGILTDVRLWGLRRIDGEMKDVEKLIVEYDYEVSGQKYTGRSPTFYTLVYPETLEFAQRHPAGSNIKVHYNPEDPSESVLITGVKKNKPYSDLILGALGVITGAVIATLGWMEIIG